MDDFESLIAREQMSLPHRGPLKMRPTLLIGFAAAIVHL